MDSVLLPILTVLINYFSVFSFLFCFQSQGLLYSPGLLILMFQLLKYWDYRQVLHACLEFSDLDSKIIKELGKTLVQFDLNAQRKAKKKTNVHCFSIS